MKIFASNQSIIDSNKFSPKESLFGAWVATNDFYKNLVRFGNFDEYHFFALPENNKKYRPQKEIAQYINNERVKIRKITEFPYFLRDAKDFIFFTSSPGIFNTANLRSIHARKYFPICGQTHTISYSFLLRQVFFYNLISDLQPFDSIVCTSRAVLESIKRIYKSIKSEVFQNLSVNLSYKARLDHLSLGINTEDYLRNNKKQSRQNLKLPADKIIILYFGRFSILDKADLYPLLFAFKKLLNKNKNILLVLAGRNFQGNYGKKVERLAYDLGILRNTRFFFNPSQKEKYLLYSAGDVFVSPSDNIQESFGLTVIEAMAAGLPVVVSDWNGYKDIVTHNETGFRVPTYWTKCDREISEYTFLSEKNPYADHLFLGQSVCIDTKKMIGYLLLLIKRKDMRLRFGYNARERVLKYYDWSVVIPKYEMLWNTLIDEAKAYKTLPKKTPFFYPRYFELFSHYPSRILNKRTNIAITEEGIQLLKTRKFPAGIPSLSLIAPNIVLLILFYLKERQGSSLEKIKDHINELFKEISSEEINYYLMWMLKHYFMELVQ